MTDIPIMFENDDVLVVNKPAGLRVHEDGFSDVPTVVDWFLSYVPSARGVGEVAYANDGKELERSGVVHRLDTDTSGVLILAKTQEAFLKLKEEFHERRVRKEYRAFVYGDMKEKWGTIDRPIGRSAKDFRLRSAERGAKGTIRDALTHWELVQTGSYEGELFSELKLMPKTGRTHQLRVHLKAIDHPIVCDHQYGGKRVSTMPRLGFERLALHAHTLSLTLPDGKEHSFEAPLPPEFLAASGCIAPR